MEGVIETVSRFVNNLWEANWVQQGHKRNAKAVIINVYMNIKVTYNDYFIWAED